MLDLGSKLTGRNDWQGLVNNDYDRRYSCEESGCNEEGICRCAQIVNVTVDQSLSGCRYLFDRLFDGRDKFGLEPALDFWFLRRHFSGITFDFDAQGDYYGEVLERIYPSYGGFLEKAEEFDMMSDVEKLHHMLVVEYGKVLPAIKAVKDWEMKPVFISEVLQTPNNRVNEDCVNGYKKICQDVIDDKYARKEFQKHVQFLAPLCLKRGNLYHVIDGTHRTIALTSTYKINQFRPEKKQGEFVPLFMWIICPRETK